MERIKLLQGDITQIEVDAIVNAANSSLLGGGGVDGAIHRAGGSAILEECKMIVAKQGSCEVGEAVITTAGRLPSKYVIHTVGPIWNGGNHNENQLLEKAYWNSLQVAVENHCESLAFPCISTGVYGFPKDQAAKIAVQTIRAFLKSTDAIQKVLLVSFDNENYQELERRLNEL